MRTNRADVADGLRRLLAAHLAEDDAPPNVSLLFGQERGSTRPMHHLNRSGRGLVHTPSQGRLIRALIHCLGGYLAPSDGVFRLRGQVVVRNGRATIIDSSACYIDRFEGQLARLGYRRADVAGVDLVGSTGMLRLAPPGLSLDRKAFSDLAADPPTRREHVIETSSELPVERWIVAADDVAPPFRHSLAGQAVGVAELPPDLPTIAESRVARVAAVAPIAAAGSIELLPARHDVEAVLDLVAD